MRGASQWREWRTMRIKLPASLLLFVCVVFISAVKVSVQGGQDFGSTLVPGGSLDRLVKRAVRSTGV